MGKSIRTKPLQATDIFNGIKGSDDPYYNAPKENILFDNFDSSKYEFVDNPSYYDDKRGLSSIQSNKQPLGNLAWRTAKQFGANVVSSIGQSLANTLDFAATAKTIKSEFTGENDDFVSSFMGLTTKDMQDWANSIAQRNKIYEEKEGSFNLLDAGWWGKQIASSGTGIGMALEALVETAAIEYATGGIGTGAALAKLGGLVKRLATGAKGAEYLKETLDVAKGLRSAATIYGTINRYSESRMEAQQTYQQIHDELSQIKDTNGNNKYTEDEVKHLATAGAQRDFNGNLMLLPLDILAFRTMVYNPISGAGEGLLDKTLGKIGHKGLRTAIQFGAEGLLEGSEEGFQQIAQNEGVHFARVLGGMDDGSSFLERAGQDVQTADFWNNFAGGVIGSPIIAGAMKVVNKITTGGRQKALEQSHADFIKNVGMMGDSYAKTINQLESEGKTKEAATYRRSLNANKAIAALHLDAMTDKDTAFDSHKTFVQGVLDEINQGKTDALGDLGFNNVNPQQLTKIKQEFENYVKDTGEIEKIYNQVKNKYNRNFVPEVTLDHFQLNKLLEEKQRLNTGLASAQSGLFQYGNLSEHGQQIYNTEYKVRALEAERTRLTNAIRESKDDFEKKNYESVLKTTEDKLTATKEQLSSIQSNEGYNYENKQLDNDILQSALRSDEYQYLNQRNEKLDNEIAFQRRELANWNDPKFLQHKTNQAISKAKTKAQIDATKQTLDNVENNQSTQEAVTERETQLAANDAAKTVQKNRQATQGTNEGHIPGNANLFADEQANGIINNIEKEVFQGTTLNNDNEDEGFLLDPAEYDFNKSSDDSKQRVIDGVKALSDRLTEPTFENLIKEVIKTQGKDKADKIFNALSYGWEKSGHDAIDYKAIYNRLFLDPVQQIMNGIDGLIEITGQQVAEQIGQVEKEELPKQDKPDKFDENNQPVYTYKGIVTNEASPKFAFVSRLSNLITSKTEEGSTSVEHEYSENELNTGDYVDSLQLLDPDKFNGDTELEIKIPNNFSDIKIPIYNADGTKGQSVTFGQYVAQKGLKPSDQEYKDKIPMIIYKKGTPTTEKGVAFVHDIGWYHPLRFNQEKKDDMANAISHTRSIRDGVIKGDNEIVITGKRQTTFSGLKIKDLIILKEANPETTIAIAKTADPKNLEISNRVPFHNDKRKLINVLPLKVGLAYEIRRFGTDENGIPTYVAFNVTDIKIDKQTKDTVIGAITIYANRANLNDAQKQAIKNIQDTMKLDILSPQGLEEYLKHFIHIFNAQIKTTSGDNLTEKVAKAAERLSLGTPYIAFEKGQIIFGQAGIKATSTSPAFFINPNSPQYAGKSLSKLTNPVMVNNNKFDTFLDWFKQNVSLEGLPLNKTIIGINNDFTTTILSNDYNDFLKTRLKTNIKSVNIGTEERPNYVTNIQPVITYDLKSNLKKLESAASTEEVKSEVLTTIKEAQQIKIEDNSKIKDIEQAQLDKLKKILGNNFLDGRTIDEGLLDPAEMTDQQRIEATKDITRIAGLTPDQQSTIVDFMYNQIVPLVEANNGTITRKTADKAITDTFNEVINPLKESYQKTIDETNKLLEEHPSLKGNSQFESANKELQTRINHINQINKELNKLKNLAFDKVEKYTNIKQTKEESLDIDPESPIEDGGEQQIDFWTDILTESPENKLTYSMRRFLGQIRAKNPKTGENERGFLGLPVYEDASTVTATLMTTLADVPSNFNTMIAKMESRQDAIPWMKEAIEKLKIADQQKKNQFVTVMSNHSLRMKFTMLSYNRKTSQWTLKVYNTNQSGIADTIKNQWFDNLYNTDLILTNQDGTHSINKERAKFLIQQFESWKGVGLPIINNPQSLLDIRDNIKPKQGIEFKPNSELQKELSEKIKSNFDRVRFSLKGQDYQITKLDNGKYKAEFLNNSSATDKQIRNWLTNFGIDISENTWRELKKDGIYHNFGQRKWDELFEINERDGRLSGNTNGLFAILYNSLRELVDNPNIGSFEENGNSPLDNTVIASLANLEAKYNDVATPFGFRDGKKTIFALTAPKFITDRVRDLKDKDGIVRQQLQSTSFSTNSFWLRLLDDKDFRTRFGVAHMGLTALKEIGKKAYRDNALTKLSDLDHEITKLGMFQDMTQGLVNYTEGDKSFSVYPDSGIKLRMATIFSPTMSDKHLMTLITTAVLDLQNKDLLNGEGISDEVAHIVYDQTIKPELLRMISHAQRNSTTNIKSYDKGAGMFLLMPNLNNLEYTEGLRLIDAIRHEPNTFTIQEIEGNKELMDNLKQEIKNYIKQLTTEKVNSWLESGLVSNTEDKNLQMNFTDNRYNDRLRGNSQEKINMTAMDFVVNNLISNANSFMLIAGDPALEYKKNKETKADDYIQIAKDTFINVGKRLAGQIAPGTTLANSKNNKYIQLFLEDRISTPNNIEYLEKILGKEGASAYRNMDTSADGQEYTTWKEHLDVLAMMGKTSDNMLDITPEEIEEARELFSSNKEITDKQKELLKKVLQPMKPVYTGQIHDPQQDVMRTMYIKCSSFPLIPQLTAGMEIDKLRLAMEKIEKDRKMNVRASYQSANKVGALNKAAKIWNDDGNIDNDSLIQLSDNSLILDRENFRIQQEVPFKSGKNNEDKITLATQIMKLLFGDGMMELDGFNYNGKSYTGKELHQIYNETFINLINEKKNQLFNELGLDQRGNPIDAKKSMATLQAILRDEAIKRGYPLQDIQGLTLNDKGQFNLPLWSSANSNRYESMLNAIVTNRIVRMKFPGNSYIAGSEEGFRIQDNFNGINQSKIIFTSSWNGKELQGAKTEDGKLVKAQIFVASKFRDREGKLIDLFEGSDNDRKYIKKGDNSQWLLKEDMFDKELLSLTSFRIPSSGHQSASQIEIVGFLPHASADLMIVPRGFTKQKGLDFDIDKENTYQLWHRMSKDGKFEVLSDKHKNEYLLQKDKEMRDMLKSTDPTDKLLSLAFGDNIKYTDEDINESKFLSGRYSGFKEKLLQNEIIKIHSTIVSNPSDAVQAKINKVLSTDFAESQAAFIEKLQAGKESGYWTPLSDEYQKSKMALGAMGKIGTGAYSLDVVFHSLVQQSKLSDKPIELHYTDEENKFKPKTWKFGKRESYSTLGSINTVDGGRSISEVQAERQNIAVDNEKLQVMGRVGLNDLTMDVDKLFNLIGLDKGEDGNSISFLFLSQPIIKDYVNKLKNANSNVSEYDVNKEANIIKALTDKYDPNNEDEITEAYWETMSEQMTNGNFIAAIQAEKPDGKLQMAILRRFLEMKKYGEAIRGVQVAINTDSKGLGKSFFDVIEKKNAINKLGDFNPLINGAYNLIGDYIPKDGSVETSQAIIDSGYVDIGEYYIKPTTLSGAFSIHGITTAHDLWSEHFPYDATITQQAFSEVLGIIGNDSMTDTRVVELKQQIFQGIKKYAAASRSTGIIQQTDDINEQRKRLFIDTENNISLPNYIKQLKAIVGNNIVDTYIKSNKLINRFEFDINKNGQPSLIKFNNAAGEEFDEQSFYESLSTLMEIRGKNGRIELPQIGNKKYTLDTLAQDLIAYSYLGNAIQEAIQFTKYVPISYLNTIGFSKLMRDMGSQLTFNPNTLGVKIGTQTENSKHLVSEYTMQYIQHNPERVANPWKWNMKDMQSKTKKIDDNNFFLKVDAKPIFISVYDPNLPKGDKKFRLYWFDGEKYTRIPVLGTFGMDEYQPRNGIGQSLVNGVQRLEVNPQESTNEETNEEQYIADFAVKDGNVIKSLQNIAKSDTPYTKLIEKILPFVDEHIKMEILADLAPHGRYQPNTNTVQLSEKVINNPIKLASTLIHEVIHGLTFNQVNKHIEVDESGTVHVKANAPAHVSNLVRLYNQLRTNVDKTKLENVIKQARETGHLDPDTKNKYYGYTSIHEFMTMALTNTEFQNILNSIPYSNTGMTFLDRFKQLVAQILEAVGVKFDKDFTAAHAISNIFEIIEQENNQDFNPYQIFYDDSINEEDLHNGDLEDQFNPSEFPRKNLTILDEKCY